MKIKMPKKIPWGGLALVASFIAAVLQYKDQQESIAKAVKEVNTNN